MNYEEKLNQQEALKPHYEQMPIGTMCRKLIDKKYRYTLAPKQELAVNPLLRSKLQADMEKSATVRSAAQLHYELREEDGNLELSLEQGNWQTLAVLVDNNPAIVAASGFIDNLLQTLFDLASELNGKGIYHLCYAPQDIMVRKSDRLPQLICHGSSFLGSSMMKTLYADYAQFVAPEVLDQSQADERSEVYSLGKLMEWLYSQGSMPIEYKSVVEKAVKEQPESRYATVAELKAALQKRRDLRKSVLTMAAAFAIVLLCIGLYFELMPETYNVEYVEGTAKSQTENFDNIEETSFKNDAELGLEADSLDSLTADERAQMEAYMQKAEDIFRKQYKKEADRIMSKVYSKEGMSLSEHAFIAASNAMTEQLTNTERRLAAEVGLTDDKAVRIAAEVNSMLTKQKREKLQSKGIQK